VVDWPLESYLHHVGVYAYRNSTLQKLAASPPCDLERIEKLEQLRALWLGVPIDVMNWPEAPPKGVDTADDLQRVVAILTDIA
jgi:3-deoxy-manno-octulosonate cytidylyltransferase (CMP-KDO synthetase)